MSWAIRVALPRKVRAVRNVEVSLIQRQRLDQLGVIAKDRLDFLRRFFIGVHPRLDDCPGPDTASMAWREDMADRTP